MIFPIFRNGRVEWWDMEARHVGNIEAHHMEPMTSRLDQYHAALRKRELRIILVIATGLIAGALFCVAAYYGR